LWSPLFRIRLTSQTSSLNTAFPPSLDTTLSSNRCDRRLALLLAHISTCKAVRIPAWLAFLEFLEYWETSELHWSGVQTEAVCGVQKRCQLYEARSRPVAIPSHIGLTNLSATVSPPET